MLLIIYLLKDICVFKFVEDIVNKLREITLIFHLTKIIVPKIKTSDTLDVFIFNS